MRDIDLGDPGFWIMQFPFMCIFGGGTIFA